MLDAVLPSCGVVKIGYRLGFGGGFDLAKKLAKQGIAVFLDFKLHDIGNTVEQGVRQIADMGVRYATVHAYPQVMEAAVKGAEGTELTLLGVTVLTSMQDEDVEAAGYAMNAENLVLKKAKDAKKAGLPGLVCSAKEVTSLRKDIGWQGLLVTPGIRPAGITADDQKRAMTPGEAIEAGADILVIGRPILKADDPGAAAAAILAEIEEAL